jgi:plastocyanin
MPRPTAAPVTLQLEARDSLFVPASLTGPAGAPFRIHFVNADAAVSHNVTITSSGGQLLFNERPFLGVTTVTYAIPAQVAGTYRLGCIVHPLMSGTLTLH